MQVLVGKSVLEPVHHGCHQSFSVEVKLRSVEMRSDEVK